MISFKKYIKNNMIKVLYEDISLYQTLYDISEELSKKMYCDKLGSCVHFAEEFVLKIKNVNSKLLKQFFVVEGYVDWKHGDGIPQQHTWIELKDGTKIDPTFEQFTKYGQANYSNKKIKKYTALQYYLETIKGTWFTEKEEKNIVTNTLKIEYFGDTMKSFKQFLIEYNIDSFEKYFNQYKKEKNDEFGESPEEIAESLRIDAGNTPEETWSNIKEYLENAFTEAEKEYEKWADFGSGSKIWSIRICDIDFETMVDEYISENGLYHLAYLDSEIDEKFFEKVLEHKMDSYSVYPEFGGHGFLFNDGSSMDIPADDHRIISMDEWFPNNIITLHLSDNILTVRLNTTSNSTQFNYLDELIQNSQNNIKQVYYDVYENDMMVKHGKFDVEDDYDWYDIRTKDNNKSQLKQYR